MEHSKKIVYLAGFIFSIPIAMMSYINSSFLSTFVDEKFVGMVYLLGSVAAIAALLIAPVILRKMGGYKFIILLILLDSLTILAFATTKSLAVVVLAFIFGFALNNTIIFSLDEFLKILSKNSSMGGTRGIYLTLTNLAWILSQILFIIIGSEGKFSFRLIYFISFFLMLVFFVLSALALRHIPDPNYDKKRIWKSIKEFIKNKNLMRAYGMNLLLHVFYATMVIYTPIYLSAHIGLEWKAIGIIFAIMLLPFSILPISAGKYSDKIGERRMLMFGFFIISFSTLSLFLIHSKEIWIWATLLFITRIGAAMIEVMSDVYFFKHIKAENDEFVGVYRNAIPMSFIVGPLVASVTFYFVPAFNFIYLVLGAIMLWGVYLSSTISKNDI
ncbi:MAG: MFS transporter [Candidatus Pacebacteria bacterium]|nr:MFS transporter [Candidatus Paceibacterota bacterium]